MHKIPLMRGFSGSHIPREVAVGSASSNISAPLNTSARNGLGFHRQFASSFHSKFNSPEKRRETEKSQILSNFGSPPTHKQKQLQEFSLNLKQNRIKKYGNPVGDSINEPILNKSLRRRLDKPNAYDSMVSTAYPYLYI